MSSNLELRFLIRGNKASKELSKCREAIADSRLLRLGPVSLRGDRPTNTTEFCDKLFSSC